MSKGATIFFGMGGVMNFWKYLSIIFVTPLFDDQKFYDPPSELQCWRNMQTPNARSAENMHFGGYFIEQNFH